MKVIATLGNRKLLSTDSYLVPPNEKLQIVLSISKEDCPSLSDTLTVPLMIVFEDDSTEKQGVFFKPQSNNEMQMLLKNWSNPLGTSLNTIYPLMSFEDKNTLDLMIHNSRVGETNFLTLQFWLRYNK